jgi:succinyl-CoA synthetase beta subunit
MSNSYIQSDPRKVIGVNIFGELMSCIERFIGIYDYVEI